MRFAALDRPRAKLHLALALVVAVLLPGVPLLFGNGVFAWTMFSKSETYRLAVRGFSADGTASSFDPRALAPYINGSFRYFLPAPGVWRHEPLGLTFRTGLGHVAALACQLGPLVATEVTLEERPTLDDAPRRSVAHARCR